MMIFLAFDAGNTTNCFTLSMPESASVLVSKTPFLDVTFAELNYSNFQTRNATLSPGIHLCSRAYIISHKHCFIIGALVGALCSGYRLCQGTCAQPQAGGRRAAGEGGQLVTQLRCGL
jgi:hypothetical protein